MNTRTASATTTSTEPTHNLEFAARYTELAAIAPRLRAAEGELALLARAPIILDLDIGGDPDDAFTLLCAALLPELVLVVTSDEIGGERARFARWLLDLLGRPDVQVVAGADLDNTRYWVVDGLTPPDIPAQSRDLLGAVRAVCAAAGGLVRWVGCGPLTNLAHVLLGFPELGERLVITQMGGAVRYRDPTRAEHNFRLDPAAARFVVATAADLTLVLSDVTFRDEIAIYPGHPVYQLLIAAGTLWATVLAVHLDRWAERFDGRTSKQHDPLTLTVALLLGFVDLARPRILLDADARLALGPPGHPTWISTRADYTAFSNWFTTQITTQIARHTLSSPTLRSEQA
ncbi:nucleoside hydrolase [Nocardia blacklockiae]|uniref:nucleoside hydrolase n=1 Tax=Nocardia blacklockiae TaxID=480036 RepID=UPI001E44672F|nr:nucleoside hydrolase [Nocardia blacklockiae]